MWEIATQFFLFGFLSFEIAASQCQDLAEFGVIKPLLWIQLPYMLEMEGFL